MVGILFYLFVFKLFRFFQIFFGIFFSKVFNRHSLIFCQSWDLRQLQIFWFMHKWLTSLMFCDSTLNQCHSNGHLPRIYLRCLFYFSVFKWNGSVENLRILRFGRKGILDIWSSRICRHAHWRPKRWKFRILVSRGHFKFHLTAFWWAWDGLG